MSVLTLVLLCVLGGVESSEKCESVRCVEGRCENGSCVCDSGWRGENCDTCGGRARLSKSAGFITDGYGNYSLDTKCSWLIDSGHVNKTIRLRLDHFATECSWDHLYVYDGDSVFSPQIAAYSGLLVPEGGGSNKSVQELSAVSGQVYLHFYSDAAYNMSGFNISYRMNACPLDCSGHGYCVNEKCTCNKPWTGEACDVELCPNNCSGRGQCSSDQCVCVDGYRGVDCSVPPQEGVWYRRSPPGTPEGRASHTAVIDGDVMWVVSGHHFSHTAFQNLARYHVTTERWEAVTPAVGSPAPQPRYGHSLILYNGKLYMFGGLKSRVITDELWSFDVQSLRWEQVLPSVNGSNPDAVVGHTAHVIGQNMFVIYGHSPVYGYMNNIQCYDIGQNAWSRVQIQGAVVKGGYGHSSVYDASRNLIYIHGGYHSRQHTSYKLSDNLYEFNPTTGYMHVLESSGHYRYLHSAVIMGGLMLVFGGNTHNDTSTSQGAKCYSAQFLAYDIECKKWLTLPSPNLATDVSRFGHSAVLYNNPKTLKSEMFVFGGFNGRMLNDLLKYEPGECSAFADANTCIKARPGTRCVSTVQGCKNKARADKLKADKVIQTFSTAVCPSPPGQHCSRLATCDSCLYAGNGCKWCAECVPNDTACSQQKTVVDKVENCPQKRCSLLHNCYACLSDPACHWDTRQKECHDVSKFKAVRYGRPGDVCKIPCYLHQSCENCTGNACMWCNNQQRCVESDSYVASFPYGQCMEWTTSKEKCSATRCSALRTCQECQRNPSCGWCDDESSTGIGTCMTGGNTAPMTEVNGTTVVAQQKCPKHRWYFTSCPLCQCNGHSTCIPGTSVCRQCEHQTIGKQCETCQSGYFGVATNGGNCTACECNDHTDICNPSTGECYCRTKGVTGRHCERCDQKYFGNPRSGTCYYELATDFQFTFNLSKKDDKNYTRINFLNSPTTPDRDLEFNINCSGPAFMNITVKSNMFEERVHRANVPCRYFKEKFRHSDFQFSKDGNTTFFVYVFDFQTPFMIQISFSQFPKIDLVHFFITFFSCFLTLLLIAAILWKVKQKYDLFRRRQRMFVEMEQMASRPFASVDMEIRRREGGLLPQAQPETRGGKHKKGYKPSPISLEPVQGCKAAVLSLVLQLPCGDEDFTPAGQTGICIGSALVTLGNPRKTSMEHIKGDKNRRNLRMLQVPVDNCI